MNIHASHADLGAVSARRRRLLGGAVGLPLLAAAAALWPSGPSSAAANAIPQAVRDLDAAAMTLFEAAEAARWQAARRALDKAVQAANAVPAIEAAYADAGGRLENFFTARNSLTAELFEARTALSDKDRRGLVSNADRIVEYAGELARPFTARDNAVTPRVEALLFLARRMRRALVWGDTLGFDSAHQDFARLWRVLRRELGGVAREKVRALDHALERIAISHAGVDVKALYVAVAALLNGAR